MLWWQPEVGETYGYSDGWTADGAAFYYSGTGQEGDQTFGAPLTENRRVRDHVASGERVRLLRYVGSNSVRYMGELSLDSADPYRFRDGLDRLGNTRRIIQFRFLPVGEVRRLDDDPVRNVPDAGAEAAAVALEALPPVTEAELEALRRSGLQRLIEARSFVVRQFESELVHEFRDWLLFTHEVAACALDIPYAVEGRSLRADLWLPRQRLLVEAKCNSSRESLRMALGQLLDYARYVKPAPRLCALTPRRPPDDMLTLLSAYGVDAAWRDGSGGFLSTDQGLFVD